MTSQMYLLLIEDVFWNAGAIKRKRSKDTLILAGVITGCTLFLIIYWFAK